ncbi:hypothetical protein ACQPZU_20700 [Saccharomonospora azurea]|uniref:hypothetical protein n=1 Tax=Saccharomonospora azurea TaxID=40988 RepID=UPI003D8F530D
MEIYHTIGYEAALVFHLITLGFLLVGMVMYLVWRDWTGGMVLTLSVGVLLITGVVMMATASGTSLYEVHPLQAVIKLGTGVAMVVIAVILWCRKQKALTKFHVLSGLTLVNVGVVLLWFEPGTSLFW